MKLPKNQETHKEIPKETPVLWVSYNPVIVNEEKTRISEEEVSQVGALFGEYLEATKSLALNSSKNYKTIGVVK